MKKLLFVLIALFVSAAAMAQSGGVAFRDIDFATARKAAEKEGKPIFMDAYASWCGPCKYMTSNVFTQDAVGKFINDNFIPVKYDMEKGDGPGLRNDYGVKAYPTFLIIDRNGKEIARVVGSAPAEEFIAKIKAAYPKAE